MRLDSSMPIVNESAQVSINDSHLSTAGGYVNNIEVNISLGGQLAPDTTSRSLWSRIFGDWLLGLAHVSSLQFFTPSSSQVPTARVPVDGCVPLPSESVPTGTTDPNDAAHEEAVQGPFNSFNIAPLDYPDVYERLSLPTAPTRMPQEIYVRQLYPQGHGYPCANPMPWGEPIQIGDVGLLESDGFNVLQNLYSLPDSLVHEAPVPTAPIVCNPEFFVEGDTVTGGISRCQVRMSEGQMVVDEVMIQSSQGEGAVLVATSPAELRKMRNTDGLRSYLCQNASRLFDLLMERHRLPEGASIYVVTGNILSAAWATATHDRPMDPAHNVLALKRVSGHTDRPPYFIWTERGNAQTRTQGSRARDRKDQCLFLRGFLISASPAVWNARRSASPLQTSHREGANHSFHEQPYQARGADTAQKEGRHTLVQPSTRNLNSLTTDVSSLPVASAKMDDISIRTLPPQTTQDSDYPSFRVNKALLDLTEADFAITHEDDWTEAVKEAAKDRVETKNQTYRLADRVKEEMPRNVVISGGVAFLARGLEIGPLQTPSTLTNTLSRHSDFGMTPLFRHCGSGTGTNTLGYSTCSDADALTVRIARSDHNTLVDVPPRTQGRPRAKQLWSMEDVREAIPVERHVYPKRVHDHIEAIVLGHPQ